MDSTAFLGMTRPTLPLIGCLGWLCGYVQGTVSHMRN